MLEPRPDIVLYDAGVDVHKDDDLGRLNISDQGLLMRDRYVLQECFEKRGIPVATVIGGGYTRKTHNVLSHRHAITCGAIADMWNRVL